MQIQMLKKNHDYFCLLDKFARQQEEHNKKQNRPLKITSDFNVFSFFEGITLSSKSYNILLELVCENTFFKKQNTF